mmetsp:Transcript_13704/g.41721  ORF Transcript_13704/g.41721 Transcript_13704/m.41721 type:complete len:257 (-) Transcript_13704:1882-2652(-)
MERESTHPRFPTAYRSGDWCCDYPIRQGHSLPCRGGGRLRALLLQTDRRERGGYCCKGRSDHYTRLLQRDGKDGHAQRRINCWPHCPLLDAREHRLRLQVWLRQGIRIFNGKGHECRLLQPGRRVLSGLARFLLISDGQEKQNHGLADCAQRRSRRRAWRPPFRPGCAQHPSRRIHQAVPKSVIDSRESPGDGQAAEGVRTHQGDSLCQQGVQGGHRGPARGPRPQAGHQALRLRGAMRNTLPAPPATARGGACAG